MHSDTLKEDPTKAIAVFDVCDTLYDVNTTFAFISRIKKGNLPFVLLDRVVGSRASPAFWLFAALHSGAGIDLPRRLMLATLRGMDRRALRAAAKDFVRTVLPAFAISATHERMRRHMDSGDRVVLVSGSLDLVVEAIADHLGVEWRASALAFNGESCAGRLETDLTGDKLRVVRSLIESCAEKPTLTVYTDNYSDRDLIEYCDVPVIVVDEDRLGLWAGVEAERIFHNEVH